jgi:2-haloalkanoic acid dehalogenase type II
MASFDLTSYQALSFDIYATLIDWEAGIFNLLVPLLGRIPKNHELWNKSLKEVKSHIIMRYSVNEHEIEMRQPREKYSVILAMVYERLASELGVSATKEEAKAFGGAIGTWPAFPDTVEAMKTLGKYYKLVALSNVDKTSFSNTLSGPLQGVNFDGIYVAEEIGSYKPDLKNFAYLVDHIKQDFGIDRDGICHTAQSLTFDHIPAATLGLRPGIWISRGGGNMGMGDLDAVKNKVNLAAIYETLGDMAVAVEKAFQLKYN